MSLAWLKANVLLGSIGKFAAASLLFATLGVTGCGTDPVKGGVTKSCTLNSDCNGGLVCSFGLCHKECATTTDCPAGQRCVHLAGEIMHRRQRHRRIQIIVHAGFEFINRFLCCRRNPFATSRFRSRFSEPRAKVAQARHCFLGPAQRVEREIELLAKRHA